MEIAIAIISAISALLGVAVSQVFELKRKQSDERRWYAEFFLGRKVQALHDLHAALLTSYDALCQYGNYRPSDYDTYRKEVFLPVEELRMKKAFAELYLDKDANTILGKAVGVFRMTSTNIFQKHAGSGKRPFNAYRLHWCCYPLE